jgi:hypothetical protein
MLTEQRRWMPDAGWTTPLGAWKDGGLANADARSQLILCFGSPALMSQTSWRQDLQHHYPNAILLGCSTAGEIAGTNVLDDTVVVTIVRFESTQMKAYPLITNPGETSMAAGERIGQQIDPENLIHVFVLSDGLQEVNGSDLVRGIQQYLPDGVTLTGGLSGDGDRFEQTYVLLNDTLAAGMVAAVGFYGEHLQVGYGSLGGWTPFGPERRITKSSGNVLYELDGKPALELYKTYLGEHAADLPAAGLLFPLSLQTQSQSRLVRTVLAIDETTQSLTFAGDMPEGSTAQLMHASFDRLIDGAIQAAETSMQSLETDAEFAILISCLGRKQVLKQRIEEEVEGVQEVLGEAVLLTGFYSYGEIAPFAPGAPCELHNQTMTITTFTER